MPKKKKKVEDTSRELLTFGELSVGQNFLLDGSTKVFEKVSPRRRSGERPFACNAKVIRPGTEALKGGWLMDDTKVYTYAGGAYVWVGPISLTPKGYMHSTVEGVRKLYSLYFGIQAIAICAGFKSVHDSDELLYETDCYLGYVVEDIKSRLSYYYKGTNAVGSLHENSKPALLMYDTEGIFDEGLTERVGEDLTVFIEECKAAKLGREGD